MGRRKGVARLGLKLNHVVKLSDALATSVYVSMATRASHGANPEDANVRPAAVQPTRPSDPVVAVVRLRGQGGERGGEPG